MRGGGAFDLQDPYAIFMPAGLDFSMHFMDEKRNVSEIHSEERRKAPVYPSSGILRRAIRGNIVSFPSQIPIFLKERPDAMQWRMVLLFFVRGWSGADIAERFHVPDHRVWKILNAWSIRALSLGYVQVIDPEAFAACCRSDVECGTGHNTEEWRLVEVGPVLKSVPHAIPDAAPGVGDPPQVIPDGTRPVDLIAALDSAIAHCEEWRGEFWVRTATLLRDLRTAAAAALDVRRSSELRDAFFAASQSGNGSLQHEFRVRDEGRVSQAVA